MRRITLTLTDEEYSVLETQAQTQRRSVREMAGFLVTRPQFTITTPYINPAPWNPLWPPAITSDRTTLNPNGYTIWNNASICAVAPSMPTGTVRMLKTVGD